MNGAAGQAYRTARRVVVFVIGSTVVLAGVVMLVTPGPAVVVIPAGLAILAIEFAWARRWLHRVREMAKNGLQAATRQGKASPPLRE